MIILAGEEVKHQKKHEQKGQGKEDKEFEISHLNEKINAMQKALDDNNTLLKRVQADFENYMKRTEKDLQNARMDAKRAFAKELLRIMDSVEAGIVAEKNKENSDALRGLLLIYEEIRRFFKESKIEEIESLGKEFDSDYHEALLAKDAPEEEREKIIEVIQKGYMLEGSVLRAAKVIIGK